MEVVEQLLDYLDEVEFNFGARLRERILNQHTVVRIVVRHQDDDGLSIGPPPGFHGGYSLLACRADRSAMNVAPSPGVVLAVIAPLCCFTNLRQAATF
jgi:hypothetical protein